MNFKSLKLRLNRIKTQKHTLTPEDMLMLVTQEKADLNSGFFSRLFSVTIPQKWEFSITSSEDIDIALELVELIETVFIPHYQGHAKNYAWLEQCILFKLKYQATVNTSQVVRLHLSIIEKSENLELSREILNILFEREPCAAIVNAQAIVYKRSNMYTDAIEKFEYYFEHYPYQETLYFDYIECLILRKKATYNEQKGEFGDLQYAIYLLCSIDDAKDKVLQESLLNRAITALLPQDVIATRPENTNFLADMGRGLNSFSKGIGTFLGGRDSQVPYSEGIIASAPKLLKNQKVVDHLNKNKKAQEELEKILLDQWLKVGGGLTASAYSLGLIWDYAHIDQSVLDALSFASKGNPENFNTLQDISTNTLDSTGAMTRLTGYVAEQQAALNLQQQGYTVEFPDSANQAGYDLIVDGTPMQVKCSMDANYVLGHFDKYPDIPLIVNSELAEQLGDHPLVLVDTTLSYEAIQETTGAGLEQIADFADVGDMLPIPLLTIGLAAYRNYGDFHSGQVNGKQYLKNVGKETAAISGGAMAGSILLGTLAGIATGGVGVIVAGGIGAYMGGVVGSTGANTMNREALCNQRDIVVKLIIEFAAWFNDNLLTYRTNVLFKQLQSFETYMLSNADRIMTFSTLLIYQHEAYMRSYHLNQWILHKLQKGNEMEKVQAGWVAIDESSNFISVELQPKICEINRQLEIYRQLAKPSSMHTNAYQQKIV
ncbi:glycine zipper family protein [Acinetobacter guillouiae]|uniref:Glycine zipper family protein n=1 Tax=Acinetobacter guillouiae TaxID=106649 RepID=A0A8X8KE27_ACIGI|nr:glycine zipper family protein [Acinetobacter guillouiae]MCF0263426.1 glycine zipper family protein [Acinetobacter guillouiae]